MRRIAFLLFCGFIFSHCQKDDSQEPAQVLFSDQLLEMELYTWPAGQTSNAYAYNTDGKLNAITYTDLGTGRLNRQEFLRDRSGRIARINKSNNGNVSISEITYVNGTDNRILYTRSSSGALRDSAVFTYNPAGLVSSSNVFSNVSNDGSGTITPGIHLSSIREYFYDDRRNLKKISVHTDHDNNGNFTLNISYDFDYDTQNNPLYFPDDAAVLIEGLWYKVVSPNNVTRHINNYGQQYPGPGDTLNYTFGYNQQGFPLVCNYAIGDTKVKIDFYY